MDAQLTQALFLGVAPNHRPFDVGKLARRIQHDLDHFFGQEPLNTLTYDAIEIFLTQKIRETVLSLLSATAHEQSVDFRIVGPALDSFEYHNSICTLELNEKLCADGLRLAIDVRFAEKHPKDKGIKGATARINSAGRFVRLRLKFIREFESLQEHAAEAAKIILESGYRWLAQRVGSGIDAGQSALTSELYSHLRRVVPESLAESVWLYMLPKKRGIYLVDPLARRAALGNALRRPVSLRQSPLELLMLFATTVTNADQTYSQEAVRLNQTIEREFASAPYAASGVGIAESVIYVDKAHVVQPLIRDERNWLVAGYATRLRRDIENVLMKERKNFAGIVENHDLGIKGLLRQISNHNVSRYFREFAIGIGYEYTKHFVERPPGGP